MIRRHAAALRALLMLVDAGLALLVLVVVSQARFGAEWDAAWKRLFHDAWAPAVLYAIGWVLSLYLAGAYRLRAKWSLKSEAVGVVRATVWMALAATTLLFFSNFNDVSRLFLLALFPVQAAVTIASRATIRWELERLRVAGRNSRNVLIVGTGPRAFAFARQLQQHAALGLRVVGFVGEPTATPDAATPWFGDLDEIEQALHENVVDEVAICLASGDWSLVESLVAICEQEGKIVRIPLELPQLGTQQRFVEDLDGTPVLSLARGPDRILALAFKRILDVVGAVGAAILFSPILLTTAVLIRLKDGSPILFRQTRVGENGRPFTLYKFRTMVRDADAMLSDLEDRNEMNGHLFKITDDPRITPIGRVLRRLSIDELPQLWNVIKGDMSLVGPRPPLPREVQQYDLWHRRKLSMRPGITGLQQILARRDPEFENWVKLDLQYIDQWSIWLDLKIALATVPAMLRSEGR